MYQVIGAGMPLAGHAVAGRVGAPTAAGVNQTAVAAYAAAAAAQGYVHCSPDLYLLHFSNYEATKSNKTFSVIRDL